MKRVWIGISIVVGLGLASAVVVLSVLLFRATGGGPSVRDALARELLWAVRRPAADQFKTPEDVIRFTVARVADQDMAEATRAFPIIETYERMDFKTYATEYRVINQQGPLPGREFHNASMALNKVFQIEEVTNELLSGKPYVMQPISSEDPDREIAEQARVYDASRLAGLRVLRVTALENQIPKIPASLKALGCSEIHDDSCDVRFEEKDVRLRFLSGKIDGSWRVLHFSVGN